jgi:hypothetical protein
MRFRWVRAKSNAAVPPPRAGRRRTRCAHHN